MRMRVQIFVVLLAIITASVQCAARCAVVPCHAAETSAPSHLPPCHQQAPSKRHAPTEACQTLFLVDGKASPVFNFQILSGDIAASVPACSAFDAFRWFGEAVQASTTPTGSPHPFSFSVLRI